MSKILRKEGGCGRYCGRNQYDYRGVNDFGASKHGVKKRDSLLNNQNKEDIVGDIRARISD